MKKANLHLFYRFYKKDRNGNNYYIVDLFNYKNGNLFDNYHFLKRIVAYSDIGRVGKEGVIIMHNNDVMALRDVLKSDPGVASVQKIHLYN